MLRRNSQFLLLPRRNTSGFVSEDIVASFSQPHTRTTNHKLCLCRAHMQKLCAHTLSPGSQGSHSCLPSFTCIVFHRPPPSILHCFTVAISSEGHADHAALDHGAVVLPPGLEGVVGVVVHHSAAPLVVDEHLLLSGTRGRETRMNTRPGRLAEERSRVSSQRRH